MAKGLPVNTSSVRAQTQTVIDYPVELRAPKIERWRIGNTGISFAHRLDSGKPGPHLLITAVVHGNEPAGAIALDRLLSENFRPARGVLTLAFANPDAYASFDVENPRASRWVEEDLNRVWSNDILGASRLRSADADRAAQLRPLLDAADYLLDLHTTQHPNEPLVLTGPLERSQRFARSVGLADLVVIDRGHAQGGRMRDFQGFGDPASTKTALLIECGQHWAASSVMVAHAACLRMMERLKMLAADFNAGDAAPLPSEPTRFVEITTPITIKQEFVFALPLRGGEILPKAGTVIGHDGGEPVVTPHDDCVIIMPSQRLWAGLTAVRLGRLVPPPASFAFNQ